MDNNINELTAKLTGGCNYAGYVNVKVIDNNNEEIMSKDFHNQGRPNLFKFFANCLLGKWSESKNQIPCKLMLFDIADEEEASDGYNRGHWAKELALSPMVHYDTTGSAEPVKDILSDEIIGYKTTMHFRIPFTYIFSSGNIYKVGLYPNSPVTEYGDELCAYYKFISGEGAEAIFTPIEVPEGANNFTLIINWTLEITNKS